VTATYKLPPSISTRYRFRSKPVKARSIRVVIPTYKDWDGLRVTLDSLLNLKTPPKKITVANDNPDDFIPTWLHEYPITLLNYQGNVGPAEARNLGFGINGGPRSGSLNKHFHSYKPGSKEEVVFRDAEIWAAMDRMGSGPGKFTWESEFDWVYFTDCGCMHDPDLFLKFEAAWLECGDCCVAISGPVTGSGPGPINEYMTEQGVLNPPIEYDLHGVHIPQAIITANALIAALPFAYLDGFDTKFKEAAGEDLDMGLRLRQFGVIAWAKDAIAAHRFDEDDSDFYKRFRRYGRGNRALEIKHGLPCLRARPFTPDKKDDPEHLRLAKLSLEAMQAGYDEAIDHADRGVLQSI
jgi:glycosyltransferase involved in cell wall biosynthesis